jgi:acetyltransferase-like isoleucine patch superfamily enzyme
MIGSLRNFMLLVTVFLPWPARRVLFNTLFGWQIDKSSSVGLSLFIGVRHVKIGPRVRIGHFTVFRDLNRLEIGADSTIGQWNWITAAKKFLLARHDDREGFLAVGEHCAITSRHYLDCTAGITLGSFSTIGGVRSTILTHQIDLSDCRQTGRPVRIGAYCFIGSNVRIAPGSWITDRCAVAMGSVVAGTLEEPGMLYAGVPARPRRELGEAKYFSRTKGRVA